MKRKGKIQCENMAVAVVVRQENNTDNEEENRGENKRKKIKNNDRGREEPSEGSSLKRARKTEARKRNESEKDFLINADIENETGGPAAVDAHSAGRIFGVAIDSCRFQSAWMDICPISQLKRYRDSQLLFPPDQIESRCSLKIPFKPLYGEFFPFEDETADGSKVQSTNTTTYRGVFKSGKKWKVLISYGGVLHYLGSYGTIENAALAYDDAARRHHGGGGKLNFPKRDTGNVTSDSKYLGVYSVTKKWKTMINWRNDQLELGVYDTEIQAAEAFDLGALRYYEGNAVLNFPHRKYYEQIQASSKLHQIALDHHNESTQMKGQASDSLPSGGGSLDGDENEDGILLDRESDDPNRPSLPTISERDIRAWIKNFIADSARNHGMIVEDITLEVDKFEEKIKSYPCAVPEQARISITDGRWRLGESKNGTRVYYPCSNISRWSLRTGVIQLFYEVLASKKIDFPDHHILYINAMHKVNVENEKRNALRYWEILEDIRSAYRSEIVCALDLIVRHWREFRNLLNVREQEKLKGFLWHLIHIIKWIHQTNTTAEPRCIDDIIRLQAHIETTILPLVPRFEKLRSGFVNHRNLPNNKG